jgi:endoglucanase
MSDVGLSSASLACFAVNKLMSYCFRSRSWLLGTLLLASSLGCASAPPPSLMEGPQKPAELPAAPAGSPVAWHGQLQVDGTQLKDQHGNLVQLKGVSSMWLNWESQPFVESRSALEFMRDSWKLSVIRAAMGTEESQGYLSGGETIMLSKMETIIENAIRLGVYVLVDWHTEKAVEQQTESITFFTALAQKYGTYPNIIWEPYNEPRGYSWPQIRPYHEAVVDAIRSEDPDNVIVMGTPNWSQDVETASLDPVNPIRGKTNLMYTLHFYSCTHKQKFRDMGTKAIGNGIAVFVTEFGATPSDGGIAPDNNKVCRDETNLWFDWMAQNNVSGVAWKLDRCSDTSCILNASASVNGPWTDDALSSDVSNTVVAPGETQGSGHGVFIVDWLRQ